MSRFRFDGVPYVPCVPCEFDNPYTGRYIYENKGIYVYSRIENYFLQGTQGKQGTGCKKT
jgi:hypothetical protein